MKRFYAHAAAVPGADGFEIHLDGKPIRTPEGRIMSAPNEPLAALIAGEWNAQQGIVKPNSMPLTQTLNTVMERTGELRTQTEKSVLGYLNTDLLCYRALEPEALAVRQAEAWDPWLQWFEGESGVMLLTTTDLSALKQPGQAHDYARRKIAVAGDWDFHVIQMATSISGSIVLALAFVEKAVSPDEIFAAAQVEELYRAEIYNEALYGADPQQEKARAAMKRDLQALRIFLDSA
ncbi:MAG TPA: ATP12 family chaperone protein [Micavibrio sp.]|jgi:chaperone required for assembly of F1-ATPase